MNTENKRKAKEYKLPLDYTKIKSKYGTLDKNNPEVVYIRSRASITPSIKKKDFSDDVISLKKVFLNNVKTLITINNIFENKHLCNIEVSEKGLEYGKKSHIKFDVYLKPKEIKPIMEYYEDIKELSTVFNENLMGILGYIDIKVI